MNKEKLKRKGVTGKPGVSGAFRFPEVETEFDKKISKQYTTNKEQSKYQEALDWFTYIVKEFSNKLPKGGLTREGEDILKYYEKILQELIDNSQQPNVQGLIEKWEGFKFYMENLDISEYYHQNQHEAETNKVQWLEKINEYIKDLKSIQPLPKDNNLSNEKTLEELAIKFDGENYKFYQFSKKDKFCIIEKGSLGFTLCGGVWTLEELQAIINMME